MPHCKSKRQKDRSYLVRWFSQSHSTDTTSTTLKLILRFLSDGVESFDCQDGLVRHKILESLLPAAAVRVEASVGLTP
eukprot:3615632-Amphidinium_carterae.1